MIDNLQQRQQQNIKQSINQSGTLYKLLLGPLERG